MLATASLFLPFFIAMCSALLSLFLPSLAPSGHFSPVCGQRLGACDRGDGRTILVDMSRPGGRWLSKSLVTGSSGSPGFVNKVRG